MPTPFPQVQQKVFFACRHYRFAGREFDIPDKLQGVLAGLPCLKRVILVDGDCGPVKAKTLTEYLPAVPVATPRFLRLPFAHPLFVLFTSGTAGVPKGIRHSAGGTLLQLLKEHALHCNVQAGDRMLFPTTLGWMMWNWLVTGLATGAAIVLYDGSPAHPSAVALYDL